MTVILDGEKCLAKMSSLWAQTKAQAKKAVDGFRRLKVTVTT